LARCLAQAPPLPAHLTLPAQVQMKPGSVQEDYGEAQFAINGQPDSIERGKHWLAQSQTGLKVGSAGTHR